MQENYTDTYMIAFCHKDDPAAVCVGPHPGDGWAHSKIWRYAYYTAGQQPPASLAEHGQRLLNRAADLMFRGADPEVVLSEFAKIEAWRELADVQFVGGGAARIFLPGNPAWNPHNP